jgi:very-short-patch-repair endonuclease
MGSCKSAPAARPPHPAPLPPKRGEREYRRRATKQEERFFMRGANVRKTSVARRLRRNSTIAEQRLWYRLRSRGLYGLKFVRQEPIGPYIVDFVCREHRLVVEVDGGQHCENLRDNLRDQWLRDNSYRVLRFWNNDVLENIEGVLESIANAIPHDGRAPSPPSSGGEGWGEGGGPQGQSRRSSQTIADAQTRGTPPSSQPSPPEEGGEGARRGEG